MRVLITGVCGFVGSAIASKLVQTRERIEIIGLDNLSRPGSQLNIAPLRELGIKVRHADIRLASDLEGLTGIDWIIDAAANPSVLAGVMGETTSRQVVQHNLDGSLNLLELAKQTKACFTLLSTSRVYSIKSLCQIPVVEKDGAYAFNEDSPSTAGISAAGIAETFSTTPPISLYGATKLASEMLALEYGSAFGFPAWVNRCGVLAGAGQFGRPDQGIFSYWVHAYLRREPLRYIGFNGHGYQTRDCFHPRDLVPLLLKQFDCTSEPEQRIFNLGGGEANAMSLRQLSDWCATRFGEHPVRSTTKVRPFDLPWVVMDYRLAEKLWEWAPQTNLQSILEEIAGHAEANSDWLRISAAYD
jgi:CDP-paratose 2-epimerase